MVVRRGCLGASATAAHSRRRVVPEFGHLHRATADTTTKGGVFAMGIFRLYTGDDGESHMEELDLESHPELTALQGAKGVVFRSTLPGTFSDWHTAPRRQYVITLSGEAEIGLRDGTTHRLGPGDVNMAEDLTGHGHTPRVTATIHMEGCR